MNIPTSFNRNLRFWALHVILGASCSFGVACSTEWHRPQSVLGMVVGSVVFVALYARVWDSAWFRRRVPAGSAWDRSLIYAARIRSIIAVLGLIGVLLEFCPGINQKNPPLLVVPFIILTLADAFMGLFVMGFLNWLAQVPFFHDARIMIAGADAHERGQSLLVGDVNALLPTFLVTLAQGVMLTSMLLMIALVCRGSLWIKPWWKSRRATPENPVAALT